MAWTNRMLRGRAAAGNPAQARRIADSISAWSAPAARSTQRFDQRTPATLS
jgi:hypothetical protein